MSVTLVPPGPCAKALAHAVARVGESVGSAATESVSIAAAPAPPGDASTTVEGTSTVEGSGGGGAGVAATVLRSASRRSSASARWLSLTHSPSVAAAVAQPARASATRADFIRPDIPEAPCSGEGWSAAGASFGAPSSYADSGGAGGSEPSTIDDAGAGTAGAGGARGFTLAAWRAPGNTDAGRSSESPRPPPSAGASSTIVGMSSPPGEGISPASMRSHRVSMGCPSSANSTSFASVAVSTSQPWASITSPSAARIAWALGQRLDVSRSSAFITTRERSSG
ncbi:MAG: hypothetical protein IPN17_32815 [Deltaproteobacteria bacterium]|nr:hypothetical protein [Deltaproteobacteria bacterium]